MYALLVGGMPLTWNMLNLVLRELQSQTNGKLRMNQRQTKVVRDPATRKMGESMPHQVGLIHVTCECDLREIISVRGQLIFRLMFGVYNT